MIYTNYTSTFAVTRTRRRSGGNVGVKEIVVLVYIHKHIYIYIYLFIMYRFDSASICKQWLVQQASVKFIRRFWDKGRRETRERIGKKPNLTGLVGAEGTSGFPTGRRRKRRRWCDDDPRDAEIPTLTNQLMEYVLAVFLEQWIGGSCKRRYTSTTNVFVISFFDFVFCLFATSMKFWIIIVEWWWHRKAEKKSPKFKYTLRTYTFCKPHDLWDGNNSTVI